MRGIAHTNDRANARTPLLRAMVASLVFLGQLASFAHLGLVEHVRCAEHGELIELEAARQTPTLNPAAETGAVRSAAVETRHGHDHCLSALAQRERSLAWSPAQPLTLSAACPRHGPALAQAAAAPPILLVLLAPKNSPPV